MKLCLKKRIYPAKKTNATVDRGLPALFAVDVVR
jgi:hypothetical protein